MASLPSLRPVDTNKDTLLFYKETAAHWHTAYREQLQIYTSETGRILAELKIQMDRIEQLVYSLVTTRVCPDALDCPEEKPNAC